MIIIAFKSKEMKEGPHNPPKFNEGFFLDVLYIILSYIAYGKINLRANRPLSCVSLEGFSSEKVHSGFGETR